MAVMRFKSEQHCAEIRSCTHTTKFSSLESSAMRSPTAGAAVPQAVVFLIRGSKPSLMHVRLHVMHVDPFVTDRQAAVTADDFDYFEGWFGSKDRSCRSAATSTTSRSTSKSRSAQTSEEEDPLQEVHRVYLFAKRRPALCSWLCARFLHITLCFRCSLFVHICCVQVEMVEIRNVRSNFRQVAKLHTEH